MRIDGKGWLVAEEGGAQIVRVESKRRCALDPGGPRGICWHWTGGGEPLALAKSIVALPIAAIEYVSWHLLIGRDGVVYQSIPLVFGAWHVRKAAPGGPPELIHRVNRRLVGVELDNLGEVRLVNGHWIGWPWTAGRSPVCHSLADIERCGSPDGSSAFYQRFTKEQLSAAREFVEAAHAWRPAWTREAFSYGHRDFDPGRRSDPGPIWAQELAVILGEVLGSTSA